MTTRTSNTYDHVVDHLLKNCGGLRADERLLVLFDATTAELASKFVRRALQISANVRSHQVPIAEIHGTEPPAEAAAMMLEADLCIGVTAASMAHTAARMASALAGARYLSLPEYSEALLLDQSLMVDYRAQAPRVRTVADALTRGSWLRVTSPLGTDVVCGIAGRFGNYCPGFVESVGDLGSPPDIEANISPIETESNGVIVVDGSIPCPQIGLLSNAVTLTIRGGKIVNFSSTDADLKATLDDIFGRVGSDRAYVLAECGIGLNTMAQLTGVMLTDEGAYGNIHFGFGSNATVGGVNSVPFHLDFVCRTPSLYIDDMLVMKDGSLLI